MKIGILTFHWATNYGAVLQTYALQTHLSRQGHAVEIINYRPRGYPRTLVGCFLTKRPWRLPGYLNEYVRERRLRGFREERLRLSREYRSFAELREDPPRCDAFICGSDQVWNPFFTGHGEGGLTLTYYLAFAPEHVKRIAYAVSFGSTDYPEDLLRALTPSLSRFDAISVRENSGRSILARIGMGDVPVLPDPALLLTERDYAALLRERTSAIRKGAFFHILHGRQTAAEKVRHCIGRSFHMRVIDTRSPVRSFLGVEDWLSSIMNAKVVITNSYHAMAFSILFRTPFIALPVEGYGAGMNDRIRTLLSRLGLTDRILESREEEGIRRLVIQPPNWDSVEDGLASMRDDARQYFEKNLA